MRETDQRAWGSYGFAVQSPVVRWLPVLSGIGVGIVMAALLCPVPRKGMLTAREALAIAVFYVLATAAPALAALFFCARSVSPEKSTEFRGIHAGFPGVAAWIAPVMLYYARNSSWIVLTGVLFGAFTARLLYSWHQASDDPPPDPAGATLRRPFMLVAAASLELAVVAAMAGSARPAAGLLLLAVALVTWFHEAEETTAGSVAGVRRQTAGSLARILLAVFLTAGGLTPYLARPMATNSGTLAQSSDLFDSAREWLMLLLGRAGGSGDRAGNSLSPGAYAVLESVFGDEDGPSATPRRDPSRPSAMTVITGDLYPGMVLRPLVDRDAAIVPPAPRHDPRRSTVSHERQDERDIPFYGVYWYYRRFEQSLPPGALERRGDPVETSFRSNDISPMAMEARQNLGRLIDLRCCRAVDITIRNGDAYPGTVWLNLALVDSRRQNHLLLGYVPVKSNGKPGAPVSETLTFRIPSDTAFDEFDEFAVRFQLRFPRSARSARVAIDHFRLIPR